MKKSVIGVWLPDRLPMSIELFQLDQWDDGTCYVKHSGNDGGIYTTYIDAAVARQGIMCDVNKYGTSIIKCMYTEDFDIKDGQKVINKVIDQLRGITLYERH